MSEFKRKAVPGVVGIFCLITALFLLTESSQTFEASQWDEDNVLAAVPAEKTAEVIAAEVGMFSNGRVEVAADEESAVTQEVSGSKAVSGEDRVFKKVTDNSWVKKAVTDLAATELPELEGELKGTKPVTRYELAVIIARVIEKIQAQQDKDNAQLPFAKIAMLEKLTGEFRTELDILGVSGRRINARISAVEQKVDSTERSVKALSKQVSAMSRENIEIAKESRASLESAKSVEDEVAMLRDVLNEQNKQMQSGEEQLKHLSEIVSRLLVKVALNDAKITDATPQGREKERRDIGALARAVSGLQKKVENISGMTEAQNQRMDALSRTLAAKRPGQIPGKALAEVKGLLKDFFVSYETRLRNIERKAL